MIEAALLGTPPSFVLDEEPEQPGSEEPAVRFHRPGGGEVPAVPRANGRAGREGADVQRHHRDFNHDAAIRVGVDGARRSTSRAARGAHHGYGVESVSSRVRDRAAAQAAAATHE